MVITMNFMLLIFFAIISIVAIVILGRKLWKVIKNSNIFT